MRTKTFFSSNKVLSRRHLACQWRKPVENPGCILNTKDASKMETCEKIYFYVFLPLVMIKTWHSSRFFLLNFITVRAHQQQSLIAGFSAINNSNINFLSYFFINSVPMQRKMYQWEGMQTVWKMSVSL